MPRLWIAAIIAVLAALAVAPAAAQATVTTDITSWTSNHSGTPPDSPYLISYDNEPTTLAVTGTTSGSPRPTSVDIVCYSGASSQFKVLASSLAVKPDGTFSTLTGAAAPHLSTIAGRACRLRAVPHNGAATGDTSAFAGPSLAISETALLPLTNNGNPDNYYVNGVTFTGFAAWKAPGTPASSGGGACGGPYAAPVDQAFDIGNFPVDCAGSLLASDLNAWGGRSEVKVDGRNAYDAAAASGLFVGSGTLQGFPSLNAGVNWDPRNGLISSQAQESWVSCHNSFDPFPASAANCPSFDDVGVGLTRVTTTSDGGRVVTQTDTWSSTDGKSHSLDLLYDDYAGVAGNADSERGWQLPGQSGFTQYSIGDSFSAPSAVPGSILLRTNVSAADGDPNEGFGAITYGQAPTGFRFASPSELEEHQLLTVPAGGTASLSYVYSVALSQADITGLGLAAQDRFQPAAVQIASPADGATVSTPSVTVTGTAIAGSGIASLVVGGQTVPVASDGTWTTQVPLNPGANTITAVATDRAGASSQAQETVAYQPPAPPPTPTPTPVAKCHVPRVKGMKLRAAEKALRKAHCKVGKVRHVSSHKLAPGRVMSTTPRAGRRLPTGSRIELFVSKGQ